MSTPLIYTLPTELLLDITERLHPRHDLRALMLTSKPFHSFFEPMFYTREATAEALHWAARRGNFDTVNKVIQLGGNLNVERRFGVIVTPLIKAIWHNRLEVVRALLIGGADVNQRSAIFRLPVFEVLCKKRLDLLELVVAVGHADLTVLNQVDCGVLSVAARDRNWEAIRFLLSHPSRLGDNPLETTTAFHEAISADDFEAFLWLLRLRNEHLSPARICRDPRGSTALRFACSQGRTPFVQALLDDGRATAALSANEKIDLLLWTLGIKQYELMLVLFNHENFCKQPKPLLTSAR